MPNQPNRNIRANSGASGGSGGNDKPRGSGASKPRGSGDRRQVPNVQIQNTGNQPAGYRNQNYQHVGARIDQKLVRPARRQKPVPPKQARPPARPDFVRRKSSIQPPPKEEPIVRKGCLAKIKYCFRKRIVSPWYTFQGRYPPRGYGSRTEEFTSLYEPPKVSVGDTYYARQLSAAMDIRVIRYQEPFAERLLTSHFLEPKNYRIIVNRKPIFYSYDYSPFILDISHFIQTFSQIILDPEDKVTVYQECARYPNECRCLTSCLDCRKCQHYSNDKVFIVRAPNGYFLGKIVCKRLKRFLGLVSGLDLLNHDNNVVMRVLNPLVITNRRFNIVSKDRKQEIGKIYRRHGSDTREFIYNTRYDYRILLKSKQTRIEYKFLIVGAALFLDYILDKQYRPFLRYGSEQTPMYRSRYNQ